MGSYVVTYAVGDDGGDDEVQVEVEAATGFRPVSAHSVLGSVREAVRPVMKAAEAVLSEARGSSPDEVTVRFGLKVSGERNWVVAKSVEEGNFEVTLSWKAGREG